MALLNTQNHTPTMDTVEYAYFYGALHGSWWASQDSRQARGCVWAKRMTHTILLVSYVSSYIGALLAEIQDS